MGSEKAQRGFGTIETIVVALLIVVVAAVGWFVWHQESKTSVPAQTLPVYSHSIKVPQGWKVYTNESYRFSISYPPSWFLSTGTSLDYAPGQVFEADTGFYNSTAYKGQSNQLSIMVFKQTLAKTLAYEKSATLADEVGKKIPVNPTNLTYDGQPAIVFQEPITGAALKTVYLIYANGYTYDCYLFSAASNSPYNQSPAHDTLAAFGSLKFN